MSPKVITFHYTLQDKAGEIIDTSRDGEPMPFLEGVKQIVPGLEEELLKMKVGDTKKLVIEAQKAYGAYHDQLIQKVPRKDMPTEDIAVGDQFQAGNGPQGMVVTVIEVTDVEVTLDGNHPLAGQDLYFDVEVTEIREATKDELAHGHAHGADGHHSH